VSWLLSRLQTDFLAFRVCIGPRRNREASSHPTSGAGAVARSPHTRSCPVALVSERARQLAPMRGGRALCAWHDSAVESRDGRGGQLAWLALGRTPCLSPENFGMVGRNGARHWAIS
jgi:hypothetical protein